MRALSSEMCEVYEGHSLDPNIQSHGLKMLSLEQKEVGDRKAQMKMVTSDGTKDEEQKSVSL